MVMSVMMFSALYMPGTALSVGAAANLVVTSSGSAAASVGVSRTSSLAGRVVLVPERAPLYMVEGSNVSVCAMVDSFRIVVEHVSGGGVMVVAHSPPMSVMAVVRLVELKKSAYPFVRRFLKNMNRRPWMKRSGLPLLFVVVTCRMRFLIVLRFMCGRLLCRLNILCGWY